MAEKKENKIEKEMKEDVKMETEKTEEKKDFPVENKTEEKPKEEKKEKAKKAKEEVKVYDKAVANGFGLKISPKQSKYTCRIIRGKSPDAAIKRLQEVIDEKRPVPMAALEVGHKRGKGLAGGKFPKNVCSAIIEIVKQAKANANVLGIENPVISIAKSNQASAPYRKAGRRAKRTHICIEIKDKVKMMEAKK